LWPVRHILGRDAGHVEWRNDPSWKFHPGAQQPGVSQPALSHALKELGRQLGLRLLNRTTRSVSPSEAGERLLCTTAPHFDGIEAGLVALTDLRDKSSGTVKIIIRDQPARSILLPAVARLLPAYPDLSIEISVNNGFIGIVAERFDADVRLGETLAQDMVAIRIEPDVFMAVVGSPAGQPAFGTLNDLAEHTSIGLQKTPQCGLGRLGLVKAGGAVNGRVEAQLKSAT
jgi:DNA-binding transcriptional LysR family regulator